MCFYEKYTKIWQEQYKNFHIFNIEVIYWPFKTNYQILWNWKASVPVYTGSLIMLTMDLYTFTKPYIYMFPISSGHI